MPDASNLLDQLEEWLEAQVPTNLHDLPYKMLETMERVTTELCTFPSLSLASAVAGVLTVSRRAKHARTPLHLYPVPALLQRPSAATSATTRTHTAATDQRVQGDSEI